MIKKLLSLLKPKLEETKNSLKRYERSEVRSTAVTSVNDFLVFIWAGTWPIYPLANSDVLF